MQPLSGWRPQMDQMYYRVASPNFKSHNAVGSAGRMDPPGTVNGLFRDRIDGNYHTNSNQLFQSTQPQLHQPSFNPYMLHRDRHSSNNDRVKMDAWNGVQQPTYRDNRLEHPQPNFIMDGRTGNPNLSPRLHNDGVHYSNNDRFLPNTIPRKFSFNEANEQASYQYSQTNFHPQQGPNFINTHANNRLQYVRYPVDKPAAPFHQVGLFNHPMHLGNPYATPHQINHNAQLPFQFHNNQNYVFHHHHAMAAENSINIMGAHQPYNQQKFQQNYQNSPFSNNINSNSTNISQMLFMKALNPYSRERDATASQPVSRALSRNNSAPLFQSTVIAHVKMDHQKEPNYPSKIQNKTQIIEPTPNNSQRSPRSPQRQLSSQENKSISESSPVSKPNRLPIKLNPKTPISSLTNVASRNNFDSFTINDRQSSNNSCQLDRILDEGDRKDQIRSIEEESDKIGSSSLGDSNIKPGSEEIIGFDFRKNIAVSSQKLVTSLNLSPRHIGLPNGSNEMITSQSNLSNSLNQARTNSNQKFITKLNLSTHAQQFAISMPPDQNKEIKNFPPSFKPSALSMQINPKTISDQVPDSVNIPYAQAMKRNLYLIESNVATPTSNSSHVDFLQQFSENNARSLKFKTRNGSSLPTTTPLKPSNSFSTITPIKSISSMLQDTPVRIPLNYNSKRNLKQVHLCQQNANFPPEDRSMASKLNSTDGWLVAVLDGHGGHEMAEYVRQKLLQLFDANYRFESSKGLSKVGQEKRLFVQNPFKNNLQESENTYYRRRTMNGQSESLLEQYIGPLNTCRPKARSINEETLTSTPTTSTRQSQEEEILKLASIDETISLVQKAMHSCFMQLEQFFYPIYREELIKGNINLHRIGTCALAMIVKEGHVIVANAGDSQAVMVLHGGKVIELSQRLTANNPDERARLMKSHPYDPKIIQELSPKNFYVKGLLQPTRTLGDYYMKFQEHAIDEPFQGPYITAQPDFTCMKIPTEAKCIIAGTDGLFDQVPLTMIGYLANSYEGSRLADQLKEEAVCRAGKRYGMRAQDLRAIRDNNKRKYIDDITVAVLELS